MPATIQAPRAMVEKVARLRIPAKADRRLQHLMDQNTEGVLTAAERAELGALAEWSEEISLLRASALRLLGRKPR